MPIESATYIGQLNAGNPLPGDPISEGDDHIRLVKEVLQSQFTSLGNAAVVRTAAELNLVNAKLTSFNGRTAPAVVPTEGDYTLNLLGDVAVASPVLRNVLAYNGSNWFNSRAGLMLDTGEFMYDGYAGRLTDSAWFTNNRKQTIPAAVATIRNDNTSTVGWQLTAVLPCLVNVSLHMNMAVQGATAGIAIAIGRFVGAAVPTAAIPGSGVSRPAYQLAENADTESVWSTVTANLQLAAGDDLCVYFQNTGPNNPTNFILSGNVIAL